jgi:hypothetical protein
MLLPFAGFREKTMHVMPARGGQLIFDAPDFLEHNIAFD